MNHIETGFARAISSNFRVQIKHRSFIFSTMDSVSQALWGGMSSVASSRDTNVRQAFLWGAIGGTLPDLDAWLGAAVGPVQERLWHRGPSHSLVVLGVIGALILWRQRASSTPGQVRLKHLWVGAFTHPILDILTGFETAWGEPIFPRSSLGWFPVVEPVLFLLLLLTSIRCLITGTRHGLRVGWSFTLSWIMLVGAHHQWVLSQIKAVAPPELRDEHVIARPMLGSFLTYRVVWMTQSRCAVAAFQPWQKAGSWSELQNFDRLVPSGTDSGALDELMHHGCFRALPDGSIGDLRFALTPDHATPLWVWLQSNDGWMREARRQMTQEDREHFKSLWLGETQVGWTSRPVTVEEP